MSFDIPIFLTYARSEYLYSLKEGFGYFTSATVFAMSCNPGEHPTLHIVADDKVVFPNIPICAIANDKTAPKLSEEECSDLCPDSVSNIIQYEYLASIEHCVLWNKDGTFWKSGMYVFSIEWNNKQLSHLIELEDGNYAIYANDWITWGQDRPEIKPMYGDE